MPTPDISDIQEIFRKAEEENEAAELTEEQLHRLILYECEQGGITFEELLEIRRTGIFPPGKCNNYTVDAELLLGMLSDEFTKTAP
jgi:hypothetical protein